MNSKASDASSEVDGEWSKFSTNGESINSRTISDAISGNGNAIDDQLSSESLETVNADFDYKGNVVEIIVLVNIVVVSGNDANDFDFLPEICVEKKFETIVNEAEDDIIGNEQITVAHLLNDLPNIIEEHYGDAICLDQFAPMVYANSKCFAEKKITMARTAKLENGEEYFVKLFQSKRQRGIRSQLGGSSLSTLRSSTMSINSSNSVPSKFLDSESSGSRNKPFENLISDQMKELKEEMREMRKKLKQINQAEKEEYVNLQSKIVKLEAKNNEKLEQQNSVEYVENDNLGKMIKEELDKRIDEIKIGFDRIQEHLNKVNFLHAQAQNQLEVHINAGAECPIVRVHDAQLPDEYKYNFASHLLELAMDSENAKMMVKHLEFEVRGMAPLEPIVLGQFDLEWKDPSHLVLSGPKLNGFVVEMRVEKSEILGLKMIHCDCMYQGHSSPEMNFPLFHHTSLAIDEYLALHIMWNEKRRLRLSKLPPQLLNSTLLFDICSTKGNLFDYIEFPLNIKLISDLLAKLIDFWKSSLKIANGIRHIVIRDPYHKWKKFTAIFASCQQLLCDNSNGNFAWRINNPALGNKSLVIKVKSSASNETLVECSIINSPAADVIYDTLMPFSVKGDGTLNADTLTMAWLFSYCSTSPTKISDSDPIGNIVEFMHQHEELVPKEFKLYFENNKPSSKLSESSLALLKEVPNIDDKCHPTSTIKFCCDYHSIFEVDSCTSLEKPDYRCCGNHLKTNTNSCYSSSYSNNINYDYCCRNSHRIRPYKRYTHKHYLLRSKYDYRTKFELQMCTDSKDGGNIGCFSAKLIKESLKSE